LPSVAQKLTTSRRLRRTSVRSAKRSWWRHSTLKSSSCTQTALRIVATVPSDNTMGASR
jgi:hypothetical protein